MSDHEHLDAVDSESERGRAYSNADNSDRENVGCNPTSELASGWVA